MDAILLVDAGATWNRAAIPAQPRDLSIASDSLPAWLDAALAGLDGFVFTADNGENSPTIRVHITLLVNAILV